MVWSKGRETSLALVARHFTRIDLWASLGPSHVPQDAAIPLGASLGVLLLRLDMPASIAEKQKFQSARRTKS